MIEVKLLIDIEGMLNTCKEIKGMQDMRAAVENENSVGKLAVLKRILKNNLKIENSPYTADDNQYILDIVENDFYQYALHIGHEGTAVVSELNRAIKKGEDAPIMSSFISLASEIIAPNPFIYNPEHGIHRKDRKIEKIKADDGRAKLGSRTYTLEIDHAKFPDLKRAAQSAKERLDKQNFGYIPGLMDSVETGVLKNFAPLDKLYTVHSLYTARDKETDALLVDHGVQLIQEKYDEVRDILKKIEEVEDVNDRAQQESIAAQLNELYPSEEDLRAVVSTLENIEKIEFERNMLTHMVCAVEYMAHNTDLLGGADEPKVLKIKRNLGKFNRDHISGEGKLEKKVTENMAMLENKRQALEDEQTKCSGTGPQEESGERSLEEINNDMIELGWSSRKESLQFSNVRRFLNDLQSLYFIIPVQQEYIFRRLEESLEAQNIKMEMVFEKEEPW
ncbi:hypothetical protein NEMIN01_2451 [Nematocida minor]|uniref:uncharacterized protein n=1 Tax=Nematocida minor TaxID=1912983 RepID=UPI00221F7438|nr:uncharacterized protein NEMIN01_2451 [Nematocida minor]KAI5193290.1 hypothetical protein NEMIN01_2451 [Nematocida minor]